MSSTPNLGGRINIEHLSPSQLGRSLEVLVANAARQTPAIVDPHHPGYLGSLEDIVSCLSASITVVHAEATAGCFFGRFDTDSFCSKNVCNFIFTVTTGAEVWLGCNEAGWSCADGFENRNQFTHCVETRHNYAGQNARTRIGRGPEGYRGNVAYFTFDDRGTSCWHGPDECHAGLKPWTERAVGPPGNILQHRQCWIARLFTQDPVAFDFRMPEAVHLIPKHVGKARSNSARTRNSK